MRLLAVLFVFSMLLTGCSNQMEMVWYQEGKTAEECQQDYLEARSQAAREVNPIASGAQAGAMTPGLRVIGLTKAHMMKEGYRLVPRNEVETLTGAGQ